jgi:hypothetical protein
MHPLLALEAVFVISVLAVLVPPGGLVARGLPAWAIQPLYVVLPSTSLLSEDRFISLTRASLLRTTWSDHSAALTYGLDYALVWLLLAMWSFHFIIAVSGRIESGCRNGLSDHESDQPGHVVVALAFVHGVNASIKSHVSPGPAMHNSHTRAYGGSVFMLVREVCH